MLTKEENPYNIALGDLIVRSFGEVHYVYGIIFKKVDGTHYWCVRLGQNNTYWRLLTVNTNLRNGKWKLFKRK